jgi:UDP-N-acetylglucosamine 4-epimerase
MKTILLTGCAGFIGSHILQRLLVDGHRVIGIDNFSNGNRGNLDDVKNIVGNVWSNFVFYNEDLRNLPALGLVFSTHKIDVICHQAALGSVPRSIKNPVLVHNVNVGGFLNILEMAKGYRVPRVIFASSSSVYGDSELQKEGCEGNLLSPYALTKNINESYAHIYKKVYDVNFIGLRYFNVFGPRQINEGDYAPVVAKWFNSIANGKPVTINGDGKTSRDFTYVSNVVEANLMAIDCNDPKAWNQVYNIACGESTSLNEVYSTIYSELNDKKEIKFPEKSPFRKGDIKNSKADISKARNLLRYRPEIDFKEGIRLMKHYMEAKE